MGFYLKANLLVVELGKTSLIVDEYSVKLRGLGNSSLKFQ